MKTIDASREILFCERSSIRDAAFASDRIPKKRPRWSLKSDPPRQQSRHGDDKPGFAPEGAERVFRVIVQPYGAAPF